MTDGDLLTGINEPVDPRNLSDLEKKHLPIIAGPQVVKKNRPFDVTVEVGRLLPHASEQAHFVYYLDLFADDTYLGRVCFGPSCVPRATLTVALSRPARELRALAGCNVHGTWLGRMPLKFEA